MDSNQDSNSDLLRPKEGSYLTCEYLFNFLGILLIFNLI